MVENPCFVGFTHSFKFDLREKWKSWTAFVLWNKLGKQIHHPAAYDLWRVDTDHFQENAGLCMMYFFPIFLNKTCTIHVQYMFSLTLVWALWLEMFLLNLSYWKLNPPHWVFCSSLHVVSSLRISPPAVNNPHPPRRHQEQTRVWSLQLSRWKPPRPTDRQHFSDKVQQRCVSDMGNEILLLIRMKDLRVVVLLFSQFIVVAVQQEKTCLRANCSARSQ